VADPGFDLRGRGLCQRGGGGLKVLTVVVKRFFKPVFAIFLLKLGL